MPTIFLTFTCRKCKQARCVSGIWWEIREINGLKDKELARCPDCGHQDVFFGIEAIELYHGELSPLEKMELARGSTQGLPGKTAKWSAWKYRLGPLLGRNARTFGGAIWATPAMQACGCKRFSPGSTCVARLYLSGHRLLGFPQLYEARGFQSILRLSGRGSPDCSGLQGAFNCP